ncbi:MAG: DUF177 domain-containing protein [Desulfobulbaceae bacterium]|nr:DUF177 domain-containing protein [Desulfobulbaceae bacterium]
MKVRFDEIPADGLRLTITDEAWFPDHELERRGKVAAAVVLRRDGNRVFVEGSLSVTVVLTCDRCLEPFARELVEDFQVDCEFAESGPFLDGADEHEIDAAEMDTIMLDEPAVELYELLAEQVFLAMPARMLCADECRGLCSGCGIDLNKGQCRCGTKESASPFKVLAGLKDIKK